MNSPSPPLRVVHCLRAVRLEHGGVVRSVLDLCASLARRGHAVVLATNDPVDVPRAWTESKRQGSATNSVPSVVEIDSFVNLVRLLRPHIEAADVVHLHGPWDVQNLAVAHIAHSLEKPYIVTVHGMLDDWSMAQKTAKKRLYHAVFARRMLDGAAFVHCSAEAELKQAQRWFARGRGYVVPNLVDFSEFSKLLDPKAARARFPFLGQDRLKILFLSRVHHKKGLERLIDAARQLKSAGCDFDLVIAGPGEPSYVRGLERRIERSGLKDQTFLLGLVTGETKTALYQSCDLFVLPTVQENFGVVLIEAMASGTPVLTTRGTDIWREIEAGGGVICDADPVTLARAISKLAADPQALVERGRAARQWVMKFFDVDLLLDGYEKLYNRAIQGGPNDSDSPAGVRQ